MFAKKVTAAKPPRSPSERLHQRIPLLSTFKKYQDHESMWISLVVAKGDEIRRISAGAGFAIRIISHVWTWRVVIVSCFWYLCTSLARWSMADLPLQMALILASSYLATAMRSLFRSSDVNENNGTAEAFRTNPGVRTCIKYNCMDEFSTASAKVHNASKSLLLKNSAVLLNSYETADAILKYIRANHDNFEMTVNALEQNSVTKPLAEKKDNWRQVAVAPAPETCAKLDVAANSQFPTASANQACRDGITEESTTLQSNSQGTSSTAADADSDFDNYDSDDELQNSVVERQQLDLARLQINRPIVAAYNQLHFLPAITLIGAISGCIFMIFLWFSCEGPVETCVVDWQSIPYTILMMMWMSGGVALFVFWRFTCELLTCSGTALICKLKLCRLGGFISEKYSHLVMPSMEDAMEEYLLVQLFFIKISLFFQMHVVVSAGFLLLLFVLGIYWGLFGAAINYSIAMLSISSVVLFGILLSCTMANEIAKEIENTLARSKPGDFPVYISNDADEAGLAKPAITSDFRADWQDFVGKNPNQYTVYGFAITRAWLTTFIVSVLSSFLALYIQNRITGA